MGPRWIWVIAALAGCPPEDGGEVDACDRDGDGFVALSCGGTDCHDEVWDQGDTDVDSVPDACDVCPLGSDAIDTDGDAVPDACDVCAGADDHLDTDGDTVPEGCDACQGSDDALDGDVDGVPDGCDVCPGGPDLLDADDDGVPDVCDQCPAGDDAADTDGDGVADACDRCLAGDDVADADADGVADACDACTGSDDSADADADTVPDGCDRCPGSDNRADADADTVADGCDLCPGADDAVDTDLDAVADGCDVCPGADDRADMDADTVADGCDRCPGSDDRLEADGDTVPDGCDICDGYDDLVDADTDTVPDGCDLCAGFDDSTDADTDTVPDGCDVCDGFDDLLNADTDTVPDGCDLCATADDLLDADTDTIPDACDVCDGFDDLLDEDTDTVPDDCDQCPGIDDRVDTDRDGIPSCVDPDPGCTLADTGLPCTTCTEPVGLASDTGIVDTGIDDTGLPGVELNLVDVVDKVYAESGDEGFGFPIAVGDYDGDGVPEIAATLQIGGGLDWRVAIVEVPTGSVAKSAAIMAQIESASPSGLYGLTLATAGDLDGDGFEELMIGDNGNLLDIVEGPLVGVLDNTGPEVVAQWVGDISDHSPGVHAARAADLDQDGQLDLIIADMWYETSPDNHTGAVYWLPGTVTGVIDPELQAVARYLGEVGSPPGSFMGESALSPGDLDADGLPDLIIGSPGFDPPGLNAAGAVYVVTAPPIGWHDLEDVASHRLDGEQDAQIVGSDYDDLAGLGDANGDGYDDFVVGSTWHDPSGFTGEGVVYVFFGPPCGDSLSDAPVRIEGNIGGEAVGGAVAGPGDGNGDGLGDLLFHAFEPTSRVYVHLAPLTGGTSFASESYDLVITDHLGAEVGSSLQWADVDGDGLDDIVAGAPDDAWSDPGGDGNGAVYVLPASDVLSGL